MEKQSIFFPLSNQLIHQARFAGSAGHGNQLLDRLIAANLLIGPFAWLAGNAPLDMWVLSTSLFAIADFWLSTPERKASAWRDLRWVALAMMGLLLWSFLSSLVSHDPLEALEKQAPYVRFPLFSASLYFLLKDRPQHLRSFVIALAGAFTVLLVVLWYQRLTSLDGGRITGLWDQGPFINSYVMAVGLILTGYALSLSTTRAQVLATTAFAALVFLTAVATAEVYLSMILLLGLVTLFVLTPKSWIGAGVIGGASLLGGFLIFRQMPWVWNRVVERVPERLPWRESSDYFPAWSNAVAFGTENPVFGIGPGLFSEYCSLVDGLKAAHGPHCNTHPHQLYLQFFAETGLPGLALLILFVGLFIVLCLRLLKRQGWIGRAACAALLVAAFWPISTFGDAFGQLRNFFLWLMVGMTLVLASPALAASSPLPSEPKAS